MADPERPLLWSRDALADLSAIWSFYAGAAGSLTADRIVRNVEKMARLLEDHPFVGRSRDEVRTGVRSIASRPHVIFYRVTDNTIEIIRVLDGRRDIEEIFRDEARS